MSCVARCRANNPKASSILWCCCWWLMLIVACHHGQLKSARLFDRSVRGLDQCIAWSLREQYHWCCCRASISSSVYHLVSHSYFVCLSFPPSGPPARQTASLVGHHWLIDAFDIIFELMKWRPGDCKARHQYPIPVPPPYTRQRADVWSSGWCHPLEVELV